MQSQPNSSRAPRSREGDVSASTLAVTPTVILYGVSAELAAECERVARELRIGRTEVRHLQAACGALKAHPKAMLVVSSALRPWDRVVVEEHAARAGAPLRWVNGAEHVEDVAGEVRTWVAEMIRRARNR